MKDNLEVEEINSAIIDWGLLKLNVKCGENLKPRNSKWEYQCIYSCI
jgi:hypothetical protein